ncbi:MAG: Smr/MutS family protein [Syntrophomonadaceae bacterium]
MKVEIQDLHGITLAEALQKANQSLSWCLQNGVDVLVFNHGKGHHSSRGFSVIKKEIRKMLKEEARLKESGYKVIYGESDLPVALTFNEGNTLVVAKGREKEYIGGAAQQKRHEEIYSDESRKKRKLQKQKRAQKRP